MIINNYMDGDQFSKLPVWKVLNLFRGSGDVTMKINFFKTVIIKTKDGDKIKFTLIDISDKNWSEYVVDDNSNLAKEIAHYEERWGEYNHLDEDEIQEIVNEKVANAFEWRK